MSTIKVTFDDKDDTQPTTDPRRKWTDDDANELKSVVNVHADDLDTHEHDLDLVEREVVTQTQTITSAASITPDTDYYDCTQVLAQGEDLTINAPSGSPVGNDAHVIKIKDDGTSRALTWNGIFRAMGVTIPTATTISKQLYVSVVWNAIDIKWDVVSVIEEA
jgi:hypothetical protein